MAERLKALRHSKGTSLITFPLGALGAGVGLPHAKAAEVGVAIVAQFRAGRQFIQDFRDATAEQDVIGDERTLELLSMQNRNSRLPDFLAQQSQTWLPSTSSMMPPS